MLAIVLGVGFISGIYVLTDTIKRTFDDLFGSVYAETDVVVEPTGERTGRLREPKRLDAALFAEVAAVPGVEKAYGYVQGYAQAIDGRGEPIGGENTPSFAIGWNDDTRVNAFVIASGRSPSAPGEMAIDRTSFRSGKFTLGESVSVLTSGPPKNYTLVGVMTFGTADSLAGASVIALSASEVGTALGTNGQFNQILAVATKGVDAKELTDRIRRAVNAPDIDVLSGADAAIERRNDLRDRLDGFTTGLLIFGFLSLFVGAFVIVNTFAIVVAQRRQELALLRAVGASRGQISRSVILEAFFIGLVSSCIGIVVGIGIAQGLKAMFGLFGFSLPTGALVLLPRTIVVALLSGLFVTVAAAIFPAVRASAVPPVAAMREAAIEPQRSSRVRLAAGLMLVVVAIAFVYFGLVRHEGNAAAKRVGVAGGATMIAAALLGPWLVKVFARVSRRTLRAFGITSELASENVIRSPRRSAVTGFALTLGLAIVAALLVFAASFEGLLNRTVEGQFKGDYVVVSRSFLGFSEDVADRVRATDGVSAASAFRFGFDSAKPVKGDIDDASIVAADTSTIDAVIEVPMVVGRLADVGPRQIAIGDEEAALLGVGVGGAVTYEFVTGLQEFQVVGLVDSSEAAAVLQGSTRVISMETWELVVGTKLDSLVIAKKAPGADPTVVKDALKAAVEAVPTAQVLDQASYKAFVLKQVNGFLGFVFVMLFLSIVIAAVGVWNTLNLSVIERVRELGVLRGIGMSKGQVRMMVRWEAVLISLYGALLGLGIGIAFGVALVRSLRSQGFTVIALPAGRLTVALLLAFLLGLVAAIGAARRASRLDILKAIAVA